MINEGNGAYVNPPQKNGTPGFSKDMYLAHVMDARFAFLGEDLVSNRFGRVATELRRLAPMLMLLFEGMALECGSSHNYCLRLEIYAEFGVHRVCNTSLRLSCPDYLLRPGSV